MVFLLLVSVLFFENPLLFFIVVGNIGGRVESKMVLDIPVDHILVHTVQVKPTIKHKSDRFSILGENPSEEVDEDYYNYYYYE